MLALREAVAVSIVLGASFALAWPVCAALDSGVYQTLPGATVEERGDAVRTGTRVVPISATLTFDLSASPPSLTAVISNAVVEGGDPFALTVRSSFGAQLMDGTYTFSGDYMLDLYPSGTQYAFDWKFSTSTNGEVIWNGITGWTGGHIWYVAISNIVIVPANAQSGPASGLYRIISGNYIQCCGIGGDFQASLPNQSQAFVRLTIDQQTDLARMAFLGEDSQTVFSVVPCPPGDPINFRFDYGGVFSGRILFHVDPGPAPYHESWNYSVSNSADALRIDGMVGIDPRSCVDAPTRFSHSNVVAVLVPGPRLRITEFSKEGALLFIQGSAGWTNVIEASMDLATWTAIATNLMPATLCPVCPYILFRDDASTNLVRRFYRCFEVP